MADDPQAIQAPDIPQTSLPDSLAALSAGGAQPAQQGAPQPPSNKPGMPAVAQLISQMIRPTAQVPGSVSQPLRPPSRLDAFEHFLGNFITSFGAGMSQYGQPGAEGKGFGAAVMSPLQQSREQFGIQQQAAQAQAQQQATQAEAQQRQAEAQAVPRRLELDEQIKLQQQQMMNMWYGGRLAQGEQKIDLAKVQQQFNQEIKTKTLDLQNRVQSGKLNIAQELAGYAKMDDASKATYRSALAQGIQGRLIVAQQAMQSSATLHSAQAVKTATEAANQYNVFARIGRSLGIDQDLGMDLPEMQIPGVAVGGGAPAMPTNTPTTFSATGGGGNPNNPFRKKQ